MILVTGASGFLGRHVARRLAGEVGPGAVRVLLFASERAFLDEFRGVESVFGSLGDPEALARAARGVEAVIHLASKAVDRDGTGFHAVNVEGTRSLCAAAAAAGARRFVHVSSVGVYGHGTHRGDDESTPLRPDTPLARSRAEAEKIVLAHHANRDFQCFVARYRFAYGDGDLSVVPRIVSAARRYPFLVGGGRAKLSLVAADEFAEVLARFALRRFDRGVEPVYHVTDGQPIAYREIVAVVCEAFGYGGPRWSVPFGLLYAPVRLYERLAGVDPEATRPALSSVRLRLVGQDNYFSNRRLLRLFPDLRFSSFREGFERALPFYSTLR